MRGKGKPDPEPRREHRITPAHAGKSGKPGPVKLAAPDHPRTYGEKWYLDIELPPTRGSPPRMRGKAKRRERPQSSRRITPAYAGKRRSSYTAALWAADHPHTCGEKKAAISPLVKPAGSPPHMRGKVLAALMPTNALRITPAHAGKRDAISCSQNHSWDHPRACGEKQKNVSCPVLVSGSPPRMRGKV